MFCVKCGKELTKSSAFCNHCGGKVGETQGSSQPSIVASGMFAKANNAARDINQNKTSIKIGGVIVIGIAFLAIFLINPFNIRGLLGIGGGGLPVPDGRFIRQDAIGGMPSMGYEWLEFSGNQLTFPVFGSGNITVRYSYDDGVLSFVMREAGAEITMEWLVRVINNDTLMVDMVHSMFSLADIFPELELETEFAFVRAR